MSSQLQHKLLQYEVPPPEGVWDKIADALLEGHVTSTLSQKLYQYEEQPSAILWKSISARLDDPTSVQAKVVPFYLRYKRPLKYSGAVAIFVFLAMLTSLFIGKRTESEVPLRGTESSVAPKKGTPDAAGVSKPNNSVAQLSEKNKSGHLIARPKVSRIRQEEYQTSNSSSLESFLPQQAGKNEMVNSSLPSDKYMMYSDGDGNVVRLPKKIFNAFACPVNDAACKQRLQQLKEKFAQSAMTADFTGLLQILKSLQENQ